ncbi:copper resistance protein CopZ [Pseudomonas sp. R-28-1W-6]|uniref:heavy-metal-associated domain-containing protein n=1 Tax=Pseudomonas sp. R-28-1W-6 TaxID=2650101 RepID=UPI001365C48F|nr:cation transporter [Pseudomonas sp. R-28-1W-6]MWV12000.1 copper resistance protein CopZ [Pseudomonas sp. R-28-1W-6]
MQVFQVQGMSCAHCVRAITQVLRAEDASAVVEVDLAKAQVRVDSVLSVQEIAALIAAEGYAVDCPS